MIPKWSPDYYQKLFCAQIAALTNRLNSSFAFERVQTFAELEAFDFTKQPVIFTVVNDEDKSLTNTQYTWDGFVLKWNAVVDDDFQPTI